MQVSPQPLNPFWFTLKSKRILVVGAGKTGVSVIDFLVSQAAVILLWDSRDHIQLATQDGVDSTFLGETADVPWHSIDGIVLSPGVSPYHSNLIQAFALNIPIIGDIELFALSMHRLQHKPKLIGVTGSNGKTTVTLLVEHILRSVGKSVAAAGNIGKPALELLSQPNLPDYIVLELSSFQLEMCSSLALDVACYLNLSEDHLDRHGSLANYAAAKQRIFNNAKSAVYWLDQFQTHPPDNTIAKTHTFSVQKNANSDWWLCGLSEIHLRDSLEFSAEKAKLAGLHNILNMQASAAICYQLGVDVTDIAAAIITFEPPPHRCARVSQAKEITWIDDSKATNPGATLAALQGIGPVTQGRLFLIAGGDAKGADLTSLGPALRRFVTTAITIGKDAALFNGLAPSQVQVDTLELAVKMATDLAEPGDTVLLSPACASIDMFDNYIHRAQVFASAIQRWAA